MDQQTAQGTVLIMVVPNVVATVARLQVAQDQQRGFAEPVDAFAVEGGEIREVDPSKPPFFWGGEIMESTGLTA